MPVDKGNTFWATIVGPVLQPCSLRKGLEIKTFEKLGPCRPSAGGPRVEWIVGR